MNRKLVLDDLPKLRIEDGLVLARVGFALVNDFPAIGPVLQHQIEGPAGEMLTPASRRGVGLAAPRLGGPAAACSSFRAVAMERPPYARS
jgi:hypothetical protein